MGQRCICALLLSQQAFGPFLSRLALQVDDESADRPRATREGVRAGRQAGGFVSWRRCQGRGGRGERDERTVDMCTHMEKSRTKTEHSFPYFLSEYKELR